MMATLHQRVVMQDQAWLENACLTGAGANATLTRLKKVHDRTLVDRTSCVDNYATSLHRVQCVL